MWPVRANKGGLAGRSLVGSLSQLDFTAKMQSCQKSLIERATQIVEIISAQRAGSEEKQTQRTKSGEQSPSQWLVAETLALAAVEWLL